MSAFKRLVTVASGGFLSLIVLANSTPTFASQIQWTFSGVTFDDGTEANGYFDVDTSAPYPFSVTDYKITTGNLTSKNLVVYDSAGGKSAVSELGVSGGVQFVSIGPSYPNPIDSKFLTLDFYPNSPKILLSPGTIAVNNFTPYTVSEYGAGSSRLGVSGELVGTDPSTTPSVPEPQWSWGAYALLTAFIGGKFLLRRKTLTTRQAGMSETPQG